MRLTGILVSIGTAVALCSCGGGGTPPRETRTPAGRLIAEQHIDGDVLSAFDSVLISLEPAGEAPGRLDTETAGVDSWTIHVDRDVTLSLGVDAAAPVAFELLGFSGPSIARVRTGENPLSVTLRRGDYRLRVVNEGPVRQHLWVGWRSASSRSVRSPGIYVSEISSAPSPSGLPSAVPLIIGVGDGSSGLAAGYLAIATNQFAASGGQQSVVVKIPDATVASYQKALLDSDALLGTTCQLVIAPDLAGLSPAEWGPVAKALVDGVGNRAVVILDPPTSGRTFDGVLTLRDGLQGLTSPSNGALFWPWLVDPQGNTVPPSPAVAGTCAVNDAKFGVWNPPAGLERPVAGVEQPEVSITNAQDGVLVESVDGLAINPIRSVPGYQGVYVWGDKTLDANDAIVGEFSTKRFAIWVEQTLSQALQAYVFAPNNSATWRSVVASFSGFLTEVWMQGGLFGATAADAFDVQCGLGSTMTAEDILNGRLIAQVTLQLNRPALFLTLSFEIEVQS